MASNLKRKSPPTSETMSGSPKRQTLESPPTDDHVVTEEVPAHQETNTPTNDAAQLALDRQARFKALKARQSASRTSNRAETAAEAQRQTLDPALLTALTRKHAIASHKLMKADAETNGEDFERKRAWDWTVEESERWDRRMAKKEKHRDDVAFADYRQDARKAYKRQMRDLKVDVEGYEREKAEAVQKAARSGGLELVETEDGELVAVDRDGAFYATADSTGFVDNKPDGKKIDVLVEDLQKAEESRLRKRRDRKGEAEDGDITYINEKNKVSHRTGRSRVCTLLTLSSSNSIRSWVASTINTRARSEITSSEALLYELTQRKYTR